MGSIVVVVAVAVVAALWIRATRASRRRWLSQLNLPGVWALDESNDSVTLQLRGDYGGGEYTARMAGTSEIGTWRVAGHSLILQQDGKDPLEYDLRMFDVGKIGIDGPGRERQIYVKRPDNVVPLRARS